MLLRLFTAIELPEAIKSDLLGLQTTAPHIKWMPANQFHITLNFLGNTEEQRVSEIKEIIEKGVNGVGKIQIKLTDIHVEKGRMIWVRVDEPLNKITDIHNKLENEFDHAKIGETPRKRNFRPHILLGKYKNGNFFAPDEPVAASARAHFKVTELEARSLSLFKSELLPTGAKHTELALITF